jgi:hypothetical protein
MASIFKTDGTIIEGIEPENGSDFSLSEIKEHTDADTVQMIVIDEGKNYMWLDENGKLKGGRGYNRLATEKLHSAGGMGSDYVVGDVFVCARNQVK